MGSGEETLLFSNVFPSHHMKDEGRLCVCIPQRYKPVSETSSDCEVIPWVWKEEEELKKKCSQCFEAQVDTQGQGIYPTATQNIEWSWIRVFSITARCLMDRGLPHPQSRALSEHSRQPVSGRYDNRDLGPYCFCYLLCLSLHKMFL